MKLNALMTIKSVLLAGVASAILTSAAQAQAEKPDDGAFGNVIIVTATKREQSVQDVPLSILAVGGEQLASDGVDDLNKLAAAVPNLTIGEGITTQTITMRGLGTGADRTFEQAVGMFIDGVYYPRSRQYRAPFFDIDRVEVVRGPQAVLFGLNSTAGAISITSASTKPGDDPTATFTAATEIEHGGGDYSAVVGVSPTDKIGLRLAASYRDTNGYFKNNFNDQREGDTTQLLLRGSMNFEFSPTARLFVKAEYADYRVDGNLGEIFSGISNILEPDDGILNWQRTADGTQILTGKRLGFFNNGRAGVEADSLNLVAKLDFDIGDHTLTFQGAHSEFTYDLTTDLDTTSLSVIDAATNEQYDQQSAEVRLTSPAGQTLEYILGAYYQTSDLSNEQPNVFGVDGIGPGTNFAISNGFEIGSTLYSAYAQGTLNIGDQLRLIAGARYTNEKKKFIRPDGICDLIILPSTVIPATGALAASQCANPAFDNYRVQRSSGNLMPEAIVQFDAAPGIVLYARVGTSAKGGGFSAPRNAAPTNWEYQDEKALGYEVGVRAQFMDGRGQINATAFRTKFDDLQVNSFIVAAGPPPTITPNIQNAASAIAQGVELDGRIALTDWLQIGGALAYLDTTYDSFTVGPCNPSATPGSLGFCDLSGRRLPFAAKWAGNVSADIKKPISDSLSVFAGANLSFSSGYMTEGTLDPTGYQSSWQRVSARIGFEVNERYSLALIGNNLTNEAVNGSTQPFGGYNLGYLDPPRTILMKLTAKFGR